MQSLQEYVHPIEETQKGGDGPLENHWLGDLHARRRKERRSYRCSCLVDRGHISIDRIGEYTGELIADEEAERRGRIYDIEDKSYLFSATKETVIDANQRGNKLRFANHSSEPNCYVKYLLVDGDYRVGIFAGQDIQSGEELLYDYGSSFLSNWNDDIDRE